MMAEAAMEMPPTFRSDYFFVNDDECHPQPSSDESASPRPEEAVTAEV